MLDSLLAHRLHNQFVTRPARRDPAWLVAWLGAVQSQEFAPAKWALGLRMPRGTTDAAIQRAFDAGKILRTHVLRPTWHFVTPKDIRWMLELSAPHIHRRMEGYDRQLGLDKRVMTRAAAAIERALTDQEFLTRTELREHLTRARLPASTFRLGHIAMHAELNRLICSGPRQGKQSTYTLFDRRVPPTPPIPRDEAIARLARIFLRSHGPATPRDFSWWSGLSAADARRGFEMMNPRRFDADGLACWTLKAGDVPALARDAVHLLPIYDEYLNAYRDRRAEHHGPSLISSKKGGYGTFQHALLIGGQVEGTWRVTPGETDIRVITPPSRKLRPMQERNLKKAIGRYQQFVRPSMRTHKNKSSANPVMAAGKSADRARR
jgi:hypothetical protein